MRLDGVQNRMLCKGDPGRKVLVMPRDLLEYTMHVHAHDPGLAEAEVGHGVKTLLGTLSHGRKK